MRPPPDSARLVAPWHVDCRLESELPEDSIVGTRFLLHTGTALAAAVGVLLVSWLGYRSISMQQAISDWDQRIEASRETVREVEQLRRNYFSEAMKVDQAFTLMNSDLMINEFLARVGRTRPAAMSVDAIESTNTGVTLRGTLRADSEQASRLVGQYVLQLRSDEVIKPLFPDILITSLDRREQSDLLNFEIAFRRR